MNVWNPGNQEVCRSGQDRPSKRSKQNSQSQERKCPPNIEGSSKGNLKDMNELPIEALMDHKVPLRSILDLCPQFKEKAFKNWAEELNQKVKGLQGEAECHMTHQPEEPPRTRDNNVAKIKMIIAAQEVQGVILDGGSGVKCHHRGLSQQSGIEMGTHTF